MAARSRKVNGLLQAVLRVSVIDDDPYDLELVARLIRRMPDWQVELSMFEDPDEGLEHYRNNEVDVLLVDYQVGPVMGDTILREALDVHPSRPVILMTGRADAETAVEMLQAGASDYLCKHTLSVKSLKLSISNSLEKATLWSAIRRYRVHLEQSNDCLKKRGEEIEHFYHHISHELKTPLTSAREFIAIVLDGVAGDINDEQREYLKIAKSSCDQMVSHLNDLIDVTRVETGKFRMRRGYHDLHALARAIVESMQPTAEQRSIALRIDGDEKVPAFVDSGRFQQVLSNLLSNALKFTGRDGEVVVFVETLSEGDAESDPEQQRARVRVRDNGAGIEKAHHERIFDRLYQIQDEDTAIGGMGIGLSLCRDIIELHGGRIWVESELGKGSEFVFVVPTAEEYAEECSEEERELVT